MRFPEHGKMLHKLEHSLHFVPALAASFSIQSSNAKTRVEHGSPAGTATTPASPSPALAFLHVAQIVWDTLSCFFVIEAEHAGCSQWAMCPVQAEGMKKYNQQDFG